jgi:hypothetical protein
MAAACGNASPHCIPQGAAAPSSSTLDEMVGIVGQCCTSTSECQSNSRCVAGRCCIALFDSGRPCSADSDCCSGHCFTNADYNSNPSNFSGLCMAYVGDAAP